MPPPLVQRALELERELGGERLCAAEVGALLHVLAAERGRTRVAGVGAGVAAAWLVSALAPEVPFVAAAPDAGRAAAAERLFADDPHVRVLPGDWRLTLPPEAPFDLLVADAGEASDAGDADLLTGLLAPGGLAVLAHPTDAVRDAWLARGDVVATAVSTAGRASVILAVRR